MIRYVCSLLITSLLPAVALAQCPTGIQKTVVLYLNGVDTTEESAGFSKDRIKKEVSKIPSVLTDCIKYDYVYNTNEPLFLDFLEAGIQKAKEQGWDTSEFWRWFFRLNPLSAGFGDLLVDYYSKTNTLTNLGSFVLGDQVDEHLTKYREYLDQGKQIIIVSHSQGSLYANEEWDRMTDEEKSLINIIAVATPTDSVAGDGPYTTLDEDRVAKFLFPLALPANASNEEPCGDDWTCHGFKESYMRGVHSRSRIVEEIVALLPTAQEQHCRIEGVVKNSDYTAVVSGIQVSLLDYVSENLIVKTTSDSNGHYCINAADGFYFLQADLSEQYPDGASVWLRSNQTEPIIINFPIPVLV